MAILICREYLELFFWHINWLLFKNVLSLLGKCNGFSSFYTRKANLTNRWKEFNQAEIRFTHFNRINLNECENLTWWPYLVLAWIITTLIHNWKQFLPIKNSCFRCILRKHDREEVTNCYHNKQFLENVSIEKIPHILCDHTVPYTINSRLNFYFFEERQNGIQFLNKFQNLNYLFRINVSSL